MTIAIRQEGVAEDKGVVNARGQFLVGRDTGRGTHITIELIR